MFGIVTIYCLCIIIYNMTIIIKDIIAVHKGKLHENSDHYQHLISQMATNAKRSKSERKCTYSCNRMIAIHKRWFDTDTTGWIIVMCLNEMIEIILQTIALLQYNGY